MKVVYDSMLRRKGHGNGIGHRGGFWDVEKLSGEDDEEGSDDSSEVQEM